MNNRFRAWFEEKIRPFLKKENMLLLVLAGIMLLVIAMPVKKKGNTESGVKPDEGEAVGILALKTGETGSGKDTAWEMSDLFGTDAGQNAEGQVEEKKKNTDEIWDEEEKYRKELEEELENLLSRIDGAGEVKVMITLESSGETVFGKEEQRDHRETREEDGEGGVRTVLETSLQEKIPYEENQKNKMPCVIKTIYPQIEGVVVLAEGVGRGRIRTDLTEAVQALFGLELHKIKVLKLGNIPSQSGIG